MNEIQEVARSRGTMGASEAELLQQRRKRFDDAIHPDVPDRVPLEISFGCFPAGGRLPDRPRFVPMTCS